MLRLIGSALVALLSAGLCSAQNGYTNQTPATGAFNTAMPTSSPDIPLTDTRLASQQPTPDAPEQVYLIYASPSSVIVRWSTGQNLVAAGVPGVTNAVNGPPTCGNGLLFCPGNNQCYFPGQYNCVNGFLCPRGTCICGTNTCYTSQYGCKNGGLTQTPTDNGGFCPSLNSTVSLVKYGSSANALSSSAVGSATSYTVNPAVTAGSIYVSGLLHQVTLTGLTPSTTYYYQVGDGTNQSPTQQFTTLQAVAPSFSTYRIGVFADLGLTSNSSVTVSHLAASNSQAFIDIGDFVYADDYSPNAANRWDGYFRFLQQLLSSAPLIATEGNHEIETQSNGVTFAAYTARFGNAVSTLGGSGSPFYYSVNVPGAHIISLGVYTDYSVGGAQYNWLKADLASVNRAVTPFIITIAHAPVYNTYKSHYKEVECFRQAFEQLLYNGGVDLALYGHVHAYERTNRVFNYTNDPCGITHITVGDGGNIEGLQTTYVDAGAPTYPNCPSPTAADCPTYQAADAGGGKNGFCPPKQPYWSAYREPAFGHGTLDISSTQLVWQWHRNQDGEATVTDTVTIAKSTFTGCANGP